MKATSWKSTSKLLISLAVCLALPFTLGWQLELCTVNTDYTLWNAYRWNVVILAFIEILFFLITLSFKWTAILYSIAMTIIYFGNYYVYSFRGRMLTFNDVLAARTAAKVAGNYSYKPTQHMLICLGIVLAVIIISCLCTVNMKKPHLLRFMALVSAIIISRAGFYVFVETDFLTDQGFVKSTGFIQSIHYDGYMVASCLHFKDSLIEAPSGYSTEENHRILEQYDNYDSDMAGKVQPHIILILNESFSDISVNGKVKVKNEKFASDGPCGVNNEFLSDFYSIEGQRTIRGFANASVLGGGTANTEYEIFTGASISFLPDTYYPYQQCFDSKKDSILSCLKDAGYTTYSMHPEPASNWNRNHVYDFLGFDKSFWKEDFEGADLLGNGVRDYETYNKVIDLFENRKPGEKQFIFDLTMQNHGGYTWLDVDTPMVFENTDSRDASIYQALAEESSKDIKAFLEYFENVNEPVMVVFLGDHQPKFIDSFYDDIYANNPGLTIEDMQWNLFKTPYLVWANYDMEGDMPRDISMNYIGSLMLRLANVPRSEYLCYVDDLSKKYPMITVNGIRDTDNNLSSVNSGNEDYEVYRRLSYEYLFAKRR